MSKYHYINDDFWSDTWVVDRLNPLDRYLYLYLLTNRYTNMAGVYELSLRIMSFETGIEKDQLVTMLRHLQPKVMYVVNSDNGWVILRNGIKNQNYKNEKIKAGINRIIQGVPSDILQHLSWPADFGNPKPEGSKQTKLLDDSYIGHTSTEQNRTELEPAVPAVRRTNPQRKATTGTTGKKYFEIDLLYDSLKGLVNDTFKAWYCQAFYMLGREKVMQLASAARVDGKDPVKLFAHLIAKESGIKQHATKKT